MEITELDNLRIRRRICEFVIQVLEDETDSRAPKALAHYRAQLDNINRRITEC